MNLKDFYIHDVKGNGNCLFRSLSQSLYYKFHNEVLNETDEYKFAINMRRLASSYVCSAGGIRPLNIHTNVSFKEELSKELKNGEKTFEKYCKCQYNPYLKNCKPKNLFTWGGIHEINSLCKMFHVPVIVYVQQSSNTYKKIHFCEYRKAKPLYILYVNNSHYKALLPKKSNYTNIAL